MADEKVARNLAFSHRNAQQFQRKWWTTVSKWRKTQASMEGIRLNMKDIIQRFPFVWIFSTPGSMHLRNHLDSTSSDVFSVITKYLDACSVNEHQRIDLFQLWRFKGKSTPKAKVTYQESKTFHSDKHLATELRHTSEPLASTTHFESSVLLWKVCTFIRLTHDRVTLRCRFATFLTAILLVFIRRGGQMFTCRYL